MSLSDASELAAAAERADRATEALSAFADSMPAEYVQHYGRADIVEHSLIVQRRGSAFVHVEALLNDELAEPATQRLCVVTDDRPGLLSLLSAAISAHSLDILSAAIYCRRPPEGTPEAVDFFTVQRVASSAPSSLPFDATEVLALRQSIESMLNGETDVEWLTRRARPTSRIALVKRDPSAAAEDGTSRVHFADEPGRDVLVVETTDRPGLLLTLTLALHCADVNILRSSVSTAVERARDEFEISELDGKQLSGARKREIVRALMAALASP